jgi:c-di-AMP phosphodiesterase-like protein
MKRKTKLLLILIASIIIMIGIFWIRTHPNNYIALFIGAIFFIFIAIQAYREK